ncbi:carbohydrate ABC transporter permease [Clostridium polynesiense]|uniref:carbohydrate ABC transporter permease n=1 Tax=Clostridium polynesiense TaxID=1325933 RepID=UPI00058D0BDB|nr:sugar ABC transporter permease [Clostridium polynesiense]
MKSFLKKLNKYKYPYLFLAPTIILLFVFSIIPILLALGISFTDMNLKGLADYSNIDFVGIKNYLKLFNDKSFLQALYNTAFYVVVGVPLVIVFSLGIAILLNYGTNFLFRFARMLYYAPAITNIVAVAVIWGYLYNNSYGLLNQVLGFFGVPSIPWLLNSKWAKLSLIILAVWKAIGMNMLIFLAALKGIPKSYYEAAEIDGANGWQKLISITIPLLSFSVFFVTITTLIGWIQFFEEPMVMTKGGPLNSTLSLALLIYQNGFKNSNFGYAAAGSFVLFAIIMIATAVQFKTKKKTVEY